MSKYNIPTLPLSYDLETKAVLKQATVAHRRLAELKGAIKSMPNPSILLTHWRFKSQRILQKLKLGRENYYVNAELFSLLQNAFQTHDESKENGKIFTEK